MTPNLGMGVFPLTVSRINMLQSVTFLHMEASMERKKAVMVRLNETELAKLDVLCLGGSRDGYFRNLLAPMSKRRAAIHEAAIEAFLLAARAASDDGDTVKKREYLELISQYESEIAILRRGS